MAKIYHAVLIITGKPCMFKDLQIGSIFGVTPNVTIDRNIYLNMKVTPSLTLEYADRGKKYAFNAVALEDGRPRTYHPDAEVYLYDRKDLFS